MDRGVANPLLHEGMWVVGGNGWELAVAGQRITGLLEMLLSGGRGLGLEPEAVLLLNLLLMVVVVMLLLLLLLLVEEGLHRSDG